MRRAYCAFGMRRRQMKDAEGSGPTTRDPRTNSGLKGGKNEPTFEAFRAVADWPNDGAKSHHDVGHVGRTKGRREARDHRPDHRVLRRTGAHGPRHDGNWCDGSGAEPVAPGHSTVRRGYAALAHSIGGGRAPL